MDMLFGTFGMTNPLAIAFQLFHVRQEWCKTVFAQ
jgi:hypothetical protein